MNLYGCSRESELKRQLDQGHWPDACSTDLRQHVNACVSCRSLIAVSQAFRQERARALPAARRESPGVRGWRAQLRRRRTAMEQVSRPLLGAQIFAVAITLVAATLFLLSQWSKSSEWLAKIGDLPRTLHLEALLPAAWQNATGLLWMVIAVVAVLAMAGGVIAIAAAPDKH